MAAEAEVSRLVVRLTGNGTGYKKMLTSANAQTNAYTRDIHGKLRNAQGRFVAGQGKMTASLAATNGMIGKTRLLLASLATSLRTVGNAAIAAGVKIRAFGRSLMLYATAPLLIIGGLSAKAFGSFDKAMVESTSIMKVTVAQTEEMRRVAMDLSKRAVQGPTDLAKAYFFLASAGKNAEQSMALLPQVAQFSTAGAFDMALATDLLTDAQSALGLSTRNVAQDTINMTRVADVLVKANTLANASVRQFSISLTSKAGAALKAYNKDVEEGVAVLAALADQGVKAELAGNALDRIIRLMSKGALDNAEAMKKYGMEVFDSTGKMRNLGDMIASLEKALKGMSDQQRAAALDAMGFQARVQGVILPLLGTSKAIKRYEKELRKAAGTTEKVANKQLKSFSNQMKIVWNNIKVMAMGIGEVLAPMIEKLGDWLKKATGWWGNLADSNKRVIVIVGLVVAALAPLSIMIGVMLPLFGVMVTIVGTLASTLGSLLGALGPVGVAIAGLGTAIAVFSGAGGKALTWLGGKWDELVTHVTPAIKGISDAIKTGDWALAFDVLWAQVKLSWQTGLAPLKIMWIEFNHTVAVTWVHTIDQIAKGWHTITNLGKRAAKKTGGFFVDAKQGFGLLPAINRAGDSFRDALEKVNIDLQGISFPFDPGISDKEINSLKKAVDNRRKAINASREALRAGAATSEVVKPYTSVRDDTLAELNRMHDKAIADINSDLSNTRAKRDNVVIKAHHQLTLQEIIKLAKKGWSAVNDVWDKGLENIKNNIANLTEDILPGIIEAPEVPALEIPVHFNMDDSILAGSAEMQRLLEKQATLDIPLLDFGQWQKPLEADFADLVAAEAKMGEAPKVKAEEGQKKALTFLERIAIAVEEGAKSTFLEPAGLD